MLVAVDIGNTNIVLALHDGSKWVNVWRVYSDEKKTGDEYFVIFDSLLNSLNIDRSNVTKGIVSSVVPNLTRSICKNITRLFNVEPMVVSHDCNTGLIKESIPPELGSDLLCNVAYAHYIQREKDVMVVDFGTALTFSTVLKTGEVKGCAIVPGLLTGVNALFGSTAQLPQVSLKVPKTAVGRNSVESIRAGIMYGYAGLVESLIHETEKELNTELYIIATGGLSATIQPLIPRINSLESNHTLNGLKLIADLN